MRNEHLYLDVGPSDRLVALRVQSVSSVKVRRSGGGSVCLLERTIWNAPPMNRHPGGVR